MSIETIQVDKWTAGQDLNHGNRIGPAGAISIVTAPTPAPALFDGHRWSRTAVRKQRYQQIHDLGAAFRSQVRAAKSLHAIGEHLVGRAGAGVHSGKGISPIFASSRVTIRCCRQFAAIGQRACAAVHASASSALHGDA